MENPEFPLLGTVDESTSDLWVKARYVHLILSTGKHTDKRHVRDSINLENGIDRDDGCAICNEAAEERAVAAPIGQ